MHMPFYPEKSVNLSHAHYLLKPTHTYTYMQVFKICYSPACKKTICHISSPTLNIISLNVCILSSFLTCHLHSNRTSFLSMSPINPELSCLSAITYGILLACFSHLFSTYYTLYCSVPGQDTSQYRKPFPFLRIHHSLLSVFLSFLTLALYFPQ